MATVANLAISFTARTKGFNKNIRRAQRNIEGFTGSVMRSAKRVVGWGTALSAVAAGGGLALMVRRSFKAIDVTAKMADKVGIATEKLVGLEHAAKRSGIEIRTMHMGLQRMTRRMAEAAVGTGEALAAIKQLGLDPVALSAQTVDKQLYAIADALDKVTVQSERVRLGFKLFDSEGVAVILMLRGGRAALEKYQAAAERLGKTFTAIDAHKVQKANDAIQDLRDALSGAANTLAIELSPYLEAAVLRLTDMVAEGGGLGAVLTSAFESAVGGVGDFVKALGKIPKAMAETKTRVHGALAILKTGPWAAFSPEESVKASVKAMVDAEAAAATAGQGFDKAADKMQAFLDAISRTADERARLTAARIEERRSAMAAAGQAAAALAEHERMLKGVQSAAQRIFEQTRTPFEKYGQALDELNKMLKLGLVNWETYARGVKMARDAATDAAMRIAKDKQKAATSLDPGQFMEIDPSRIMVAGLAGRGKRKQVVEDKQLAQTNKTLQQIERKIGVTATPRAA